MNLIPWELGRPIVWDATCVDTPSHLMRTSMRVGAEADLAEDLKRRKYAGLDRAYEFAPLGVETLGRWGTEAHRIFKLSERLVEATRDLRADGLYDRLLCLDEEYYQLPALFHLEDYERCLADDDGVYCLGTFHLTPLRIPHLVYQLMEEYSEPYAYNHTLIHRGVCISSRCPHLNTSDVTIRFQRCTAEVLLRDSFQANLTALGYCHRRVDRRVEAPTVAQILFLIICLVLIAMNIIGTLYDVCTRDSPKRRNTLLALSVIQNWRFLTNCNEEKDQSTALKSLHGIRVCVAICACLSHSGLIFYSLFLQDPRVMEKMTKNPLTMLVQNSTPSEQMFVVISGFLLTYGIRVFSEKHSLSLRLLPIFIAKRIIRISPVYYLVVGFAATWWPSIGSGPLWSVTVGVESQICREKFWTQLLFVNNLVQAERHCVLPTWYMALDVQMHILSSFVGLALLKYPRRTLMLCGLVAASCTLNAALVYLNHWLPMLYLTVSTEILRKRFSDVPSYVGLYISPWGSMTACFLGQILGHLYYEMKDEDFLIQKYKWLLNLACLVSIPLLVTWTLLGYWIQHMTAPVFVALYAALERSIFQVLCLLSFVVFSIVNGLPIRVLSWRGWRPLSRMSLSVMIVHWIVNMALVATAQTTLPTSFLDIIMYGTTTAVYTFLIAVPITILVEIPMKKLFDIVCS